MDKFSSFDDSNFSFKKINSRGVRRIDNNTNKRMSDIFNMKDEVSYNNSSLNKINKEKIKEIAEKMIDDKMSRITPFVKGVRNSDFTPRHLNSSYDLDRIQNKNQTNEIKQTPNKRFLNNSIHVPNTSPENRYNALSYIDKEAIEKCSSQKFAHKNLLDFNDKNKEILINKQQLKLNRQADLIKTVTYNLISVKNISQKEKLSKKFQEVKGLFSTEFRKDHVRIKAIEKLKLKEDFKNKNPQIYSLQPSHIPEKIKEESSQVDKRITEKDLDKYFKDVRTISHKLRVDKILEKEELSKKDKPLNTRNEDISNPIRKIKVDFKIKEIKDKNNHLKSNEIHDKNNNSKATSSVRRKDISVDKCRKSPMKFK